RALTDAVVFEEFIQKRFLGAKSFSIEGAESLLALLRELVERCGEQGIEEVVIGMSHRGRLNVLTHLVGKPARHILRQFAGLEPHEQRGRGDVKYHMGWTGERDTRSGKRVRLMLCHNASHLEFVDPVAIGRARGRQVRRGDPRGERVLGLLVHGDAAFAGEGIVQETLNLSRLEGYSTGGTLHVIVNNQLGFTTDPRDARSTPYASDAALMLSAPVLHVNGEDPEAAVEAAAFALDWRARFHSDVVIDLVCFRRRGHNETDEPAFTQPLL